LRVTSPRGSLRRQGQTSHSKYEIKAVRKPEVGSAAADPLKERVAGMLEKKSSTGRNVVNRTHYRIAKGKQETFAAALGWKTNGGQSK